MVTIAQRIEELRTERGLTRPALSTALGLPRMAAEKFETGRQTPTKDQQVKLAAFFGVSLFYLRGESNDRTQMEDWMDQDFEDAAPTAGYMPRKAARAAAKPDPNRGTVMDAFSTSKSFQDSIRAAVLDVLRSEEGKALLDASVRRVLNK